MESIRLKARAKINLGLDVIGRRDYNDKDSGGRDKN